MNFIGKIFPVDGYYVILDGNLPVDYAKSLTHLYQPLVGMQAVALYQTLLHEIELQLNLEPQTHHTLMNYLNIPLDEIYQARLKLEGIGLLQTYESGHTDEKYYTYALQHPFSPRDFFKDAMLTQLLNHHLGETKFDMLKQFYMHERISESRTNITASFEDVFQTFQPSFAMKEPVEGNQADPSPNVKMIDFTWMEHMLNQRMVPVTKVLTEYNRKVISQMMVLYGLAAHEMEKAVLWALTEENTLDIEELKAACHDLFKTQSGGTPVQLTERVIQPEQKIKKKSETKEEQLIYELETISPKQLLEDLSSGNQASEQDMRAIREVMTTQGLPSPVMNVLIHYVLLQSNMKLSKAYLEKIASHWSRANLKTAKEAMAFAKRETEKHQKGTTASNRKFRKQVSNEVVPDWFKEREKKQEEAAKQKKQAENQVIDEEKEKEELLALLRMHADKN